MKRLVALAAAAMTFAAIEPFSYGAEPQRPIDRANVLPLALDDHFQFRKVEQFLNDPQFFKPSSEPMIDFFAAKSHGTALSRHSTSKGIRKQSVATLGRFFKTESRNTLLFWKFRR